MWLTLSVLLLSSSVTALSQTDCISTYSDILAEQITCGETNFIKQCILSLSILDTTELAACLIKAGCSASQATYDTSRIFNRCSDLPQGHELLRKRALLPRRPSPTNFDPDQILLRDETTPTSTINNNNKMGSACFAFGTTSTTSCASETVNGKVTTKDCTPVPLTTSDCLKGYICTLDSNHQDVCMQAHNSLDTSGIVIAIIFGTFILIGIGYITFACFRESRRDKRLAAKAEAVALARAATKKQRSQEARTPLMQQTQDDGPNPFQDQLGHV